MNPFVLATPALPVYTSAAVIVFPDILFAATDRVVGDDVQVVADAAVVSETTVRLATQVVPRTFCYFARIDALAYFDDALAAFIGDSAAQPTAATNRRMRAWMITAAVLAADGMVLTYYHQKRGRKARELHRGRLIPAFARR
jgi:hypothetical protein